MSSVRRLLLLSIVLIPFIASSQTHDYKVRKCFGYQRDSCANSENVYYKHHEDSRSALFVKGQTSQTIIAIYNGRDYRISLCWDPVLGNRLGFKIIDRDTGGVLYDNSTDEFASEFEFTVTLSQEIIVEITVPGESGLSRTQDNQDLVLVQKDTDMGCVGVLVEHMITPSKGF